MLAGLVSSEPSLKVIDISSVTACSPSLVSAFSHLESCALHHKTHVYLDLAPLGILPGLNHLLVTGWFQGLQHLAGLTYLQCQSAVVKGVQEFAPTLQHLDIDRSCLQHVRVEGLTACTALTQLVLKESSLAAGNEVHLSTDLTLVPTNIQLLTQLHTLHLAGGRNCSLGDLQWISKLTALHDLSVSFGSDCDDVLQHVEELAKLTCLKLVGLRDGLAAGLNINWHKLQALQHLSICNFTLMLDIDVGGLLQLQHLKEIWFAGCTVTGELNAFVALMYNLARVHPHVNAHFNPEDGDLQNYFA